jgi:hypothetical protein
MIKQTFKRWQNKNKRKTQGSNDIANEMRLIEEPR